MSELDHLAGRSSVDGGTRHAARENAIAVACPRALPLRDEDVRHGVVKNRFDEAVAPGLFVVDADHDARATLEDAEDLPLHRRGFVAAPGASHPARARGLHHDEIARVTVHQAVVRDEDVSGVGLRDGVDEAETAPVHVQTTDHPTFAVGAAPPAPGDRDGQAALLQAAEERVQLAIFASGDPEALGERVEGLRRVVVAGKELEHFGLEDGR